MRRDFLPWHHHPGHPEVVVPVRVDATGRRGPTAKAARCGRWRTVAPGWFVPAGTDSASTDQRVVEAAVRLGAYGGVTGWAALHWRGARWFDGAPPGSSGPAPVVLATGGGGRRAVAGCDVSQDRLVPAHLDVVDGLRLVTAARAVLHEVCRAPTLAAAVQVVDMACYDDLVSVDDLLALLPELGPATGIGQAREALQLADENSWSPPETTMRLRWTDAGRPRPLCNVPLFTPDGRFLMTPDLLDPVHGVVAEYDGAGHLDAGTKQRDVRRDDLHRRHGLEVAVMTAPDLGGTGAFEERLGAAYARAFARTGGERTWTSVAPMRWRRTTTVAQRRALAERDRRWLLRHRAA